LTKYTRKRRKSSRRRWPKTRPTNRTLTNFSWCSTRTSRRISSSSRSTRPHYRTLSTPSSPSSTLPTRTSSFFLSTYTSAKTPTTSSRKAASISINSTKTSKTSTLRN
jgi:hypothetical protein